MSDFSLYRDRRRVVLLRSECHACYRHGRRQSRQPRPVLPKRGTDARRRHDARIKREEMRRWSPKKRAEIREYQRIWLEGKRRAQGIPPRPLNRKPPQGKNEGLSVPAEPFARWLRANRPDMPIDEWATHLGCDETFIRRHLKGEYERIHIDTADRILMAGGSHLSDIYPFEEVA